MAVKIRLKKNGTEKSSLFTESLLQMQDLQEMVNLSKKSVLTIQTRNQAYSK